MRNIEELASEEDLRLQEENSERLRGVFLLLAWGLGLWGWYRFAHQRLDQGALAITLSLIFFALRWNASKAVSITSSSFKVGFLVACMFLGLYFWTALPSFYWGNDPAFWLSVHAGAVVEPIWSPLSYLLAEAVCGLFPTKIFSILPLISACVTAMVLFVEAQELFSYTKRKNKLNILFVLAACAALGLSKPFWAAGTMGLGLVSSLGLLLFLMQRHLLLLGKEHSAIIYFLLGLLWSTHPLWGLLGTAIVLSSENKTSGLRANGFPFILGLSPYLWVFLRTDRFFPSWGGENPFLELLKEARGLWLNHFTLDWSWMRSLQALGWEVLLLLILAALLGLFNLLMGVEISKRDISPADFWIWLGSGAGALFFYSDGTDNLGVTSLWFVMAVVGFFSLSFHRRVGWGYGIGSKKSVGMICVLALALVCVLSWLPGQRLVRNRDFFPEQQAFNLIRPLGSKTILVCDDLFEFYACLEARWMEPSSQTDDVLNKAYLDKRWYIEQWIEHQPAFFFSLITGPTDLILKSVILNNRDQWQIQWVRQELPADWKEPEADSTVLTQMFQSESAPVDPAGFQYHYDLSRIPTNSPSLDVRSKEHLAHYVEGFNELGLQLMATSRYREAIHAFDRAAKLDPSDQESRNELSLIYSEHNILEAAQLEDESIVKTYPEKISEMTQAVDQAQESKDESAAADDLGQLVDLHSKLADAQYQLSKIYDQQGKGSEAKLLLAAAVQMDPKQINAQMDLGYWMEKEGEWEKAQEAFRSVLVVNPQNKEAQLELWKLLNRPQP